jgi:protein SCO1/2
VIFILLAGLPIAFVAWRAVSVREERRSAAIREALPVLSQVPDFDLVERSERPLRAADLRGKIWVADFMFTYCAGPCPIMSSRMAQLQREIADLKDVVLVSFSVDPERDTPAVLREYAERYGADPARWLFATGDKRTIDMLAVEGFKVGSVENPIYHSTRFILVDREGRIRGYYDSEEPEAVPRLAADIRALRQG